MLLTDLSVPLPGFGPPLGPYVRPNLLAGIETPGPRISRPAAMRDPAIAISQQLGQVLGPGIPRIARQVDFFDATSRSSIGQRVLAQPLVRQFLSNSDTFRLLNSQSLTFLFGPVGASSPSELTNFEVFSSDDGTTLIEIEGLTTDFIINMSNVSSLFSIPPGQLGPGIEGFQVEVNNPDILFRSDGDVTITVPLDDLPAAVQDQVLNAGALARLQIPPVFESVGPLLTDIFQSSGPLTAPQVVTSVPGFDQLERVARRAMPNALRAPFGRIARLAVDRDLFNILNDAQVEQILDGVDVFLRDLQTLLELGTLNPPTPPTQIDVPDQPLLGTLAITIGQLRDLPTVLPGAEGIELGDVGLLEGRLDFGVVFDMRGNYGLILTARGTLDNALPQAVQSLDNLAGEIRIEVSDADDLAMLNSNLTALPISLEDVDTLNLYQLQGGSLGSALSGSVTSGVGESIRLMNASVGFGVGFEAGTGVQYTRVIPLGNVFA